MVKKEIQPLLEIGFYQQVYIPVKNKLDISVRELGHNINPMEYPHYIVGIIASAGISINKEKYQIPIKINTYLPFIRKYRQTDGITDTIQPFYRIYVQHRKK